MTEDICQVSCIHTINDISFIHKYLTISDIYSLVTDWYPFDRGFRQPLRMLGLIGTYYNDRLYIVVCYGSMRHTAAVKDKKVCHNIVENKEMKKFITKLKKTKSVYETYIICIDTNVMLYEWCDYLVDPFFKEFFYSK